ncbi:MAG: dethiobiotin synthase [Aureispira sp.]|nr:dethiobiotin synthase [Aureispira sp.]
MSAKRYFVTGIDTDIGKTVISAVLVEALQADYWKPIQSGDLEYSDTQKVQALVSNSKSKFFPETYRLNTPASPHYSAELDGVKIELEAFKMPETENDLIVEGAGGLMVPLNDEYLVIDLIASLGIPVVLVAKNYLGSINHTLLSIEMLKERNIPIQGVIFNGKPTPATESYILNYTKVRCLGNFEWVENISKDIIKEWSMLVRYLYKQI